MITLKLKRDHPLFSLLTQEQGDTNPFATPHPPAMKKPRNPRQRKDHWKQIWADYPERMRKHVSDLNAARTEKMRERCRLLNAVLPQIPDEPLRACDMRDSVMNAWNEAYGDGLCKRKSWAIVQMALRQKIILHTADRMYVKAL